jgi:hypothetical protein
LVDDGRSIGFLGETCAKFDLPAGLVQRIMRRLAHNDGEFMQLDETDRRILRHWLAEPALDRAELAARAGVTAATCGGGWNGLRRRA